MLYPNKKTRYQGRAAEDELHGSIPYSKLKWAKSRLRTEMNPSPKLQRLRFKNSSFENYWNLKNILRIQTVPLLSSSSLCCGEESVELRGCRNASKPQSFAYSFSGTADSLFVCQSSAELIKGQDHGEILKPGRVWTWGRSNKIWEGQGLLSPGEGLWLHHHPFL